MSEQSSASQADKLSVRPSEAKRAKWQRPTVIKATLNQAGQCPISNRPSMVPRPQK